MSLCIDVGYGNSTQGSEFRVRDEAWNFHIPHRYNMKDYFSHITNIKIFGFNLQKVTCDAEKMHNVNIKSGIFTLKLI
jgi:hypothetical protein